jgi:hypothetical protein
MPMVGGSLQILRLLPPLKLVAMILLKVDQKLNQIKFSFDFTLFCNLQSRARTHTTLAIDLYELLGNPTT